MERFLGLFYYRTDYFEILRINFKLIIKKIVLIVNFVLKIGLRVEKQAYFRSAYLILIFNGKCRAIACFKEDIYL